MERDAPFVLRPSSLEAERDEPVERWRDEPAHARGTCVAGSTALGGRIESVGAALSANHVEAFVPEMKSPRDRRDAASMTVGEAEEKRDALAERPLRETLCELIELNTRCENEKSRRRSNDDRAAFRAASGTSTGDAGANAPTTGGEPESRMVVPPEASSSAARRLRARTRAKEIIRSVFEAPGTNAQTEKGEEGSADQRPEDVPTEFHVIATKRCDVCQVKLVASLVPLVASILLEAEDEAADVNAAARPPTVLVRAVSLGCRCAARCGLGAASYILYTPNTVVCKYVL